MFLHGKIHQKEKHLFDDVVHKSQGETHLKPKFTPAPAQGFPGEFVRVDPDVKFFEGKNIDGVHLLNDFDKAREIQVKLGNYSNGPTNFFPVMWPFTLSTKNLHYLETMPYIMATKPIGHRFLLYIDSTGTIYLENMTQQIFYVDEDHAFEFQSDDGRPITDTVLDGIITKKKHTSDIDEVGERTETGTTGRLTFVIQDAIRCNGRDLTNLNILTRIADVKNHIIKPRQFNVKNRIKSIARNNEPFDLDIVELKDTRFAEEFLSDEFENEFKYPLRSFEFFPRKKGYVCQQRQCADFLQWSENDTQECSFLLKLKDQSEKSNKAVLYVVGPRRIELPYCTITLTDEIKKFANQIIDCDYVDHHWVFKKVRYDRKHPNGRRTVNAKVDALQHAVTRNRLLTALESFKIRN